MSSLETTTTVSRRVQWWRAAYWVLLATWIFDAALVLNKVRAGLFTSYAADLTLPAFLYIVVRSLHAPARPHWTTKLFGRSPELAAFLIFGGSTLTEISQIFWPNGFFAGYFDPYDIVAYGTGVGACYVIEKHQKSKPASVAA